MHPKQRQILRLIDDYKLPEAFALLDELNLTDPNYGRLKQSYLATGASDPDFVGRLRVLVQNLQLTSSPMPDHKAHLTELIRRSKLKQAIEELYEASEQNEQKDVYDGMLNLSARYHRALSDKNRGLSTSEQFNVKLVSLEESFKYYLEEYEPDGRFVFKSSLKPVERSLASEEADIPTPPISPSTGKKVFISYSTQDRAIADRIVARLEAENMQVTIDVVDFQPGVNLTTSIEQHLRANEVVISLVSENSLKSDWVAIESNILLQEERMYNKLLLTVLLDKAVLDDDKIKAIEEKKERDVQELTQRIIGRLNNNQDTDHLDEKRKRGRNFLKNFPKIVKRIREHLAIDISGQQFDSGMDRIIARIKASRS